MTAINLGGDGSGGETAAVPAAAVADGSVLAGIELFSKLTADELAALGRLLKTRRFGAGQTVVLIGDRGTDFYVVQQGRVHVSAPDESGKEVAIAELGPGNFFGEISLLDGGPRTATVRAGQATGGATLLSLERAQFVQFLVSHPQASVHILTTLGARQRDLLDKLRGIRNVNEAVAGEQTRLQRVLSSVANVFSSERFLILNLTFIVIWMVVHSILWRDKIVWLDQPPTFFWLGFMVTVEAIVVAMFVLNAQRRQAERDRVRADLEYQVNVKAHVEVMELHRKVDRLLEAGNLKK
jgi:CRP/FNR family transcriptional regulator, cyclic AMP receptor protein